MAGIRLEMDPNPIMDGAKRAKSAIEAIAAEALETEKRLMDMGDKGAHLSKIKTALDPVYGAAIKASRSIKEYDDALDAGIITAQQYAQAMSRLKTGLDAAGGRATGAFRNLGSAAQQVGYQVADFASQVSAGGSAVTAFSQQGSQLLGMFGPWGAVFGAAVAVVLPLGAAFLSTAEDAKTTEDALSDMGDAFDQYMSYARLAAEDTAELTERFGEFSGQVRGFSEFMRQVSIGAALEGADGVINSLVGGLGEVEAAYLRVQGLQAIIAEGEEGGMTEATVRARQNMALYQMELEAAAEAMGLTVDQSLALLDAMRAVSDADTMSEMAESAGAALALLQDMVGSGYELPPALREAAAALEEIHRTAAEANAVTSGLPGILDSARDAADAAASAVAGIGSAASGAVGAVQGLATAMWNAAMTRVQANQYVESNQPGGAGYLASQYAQYGAGRAAFDKGAKSSDDLYNPPAAVTGAGRSAGGGGKSAVQQAAEDYDRLLASLDPSVRAANEFAEAQETINAALKAGHITGEQAAETLALARKEMEEATGAAGEFSDLMQIGGNAIDRLIEGTSSLKDIWRDVVKEIALAIVKKNLLANVQGGAAGDSVGTLIAKGLFGGFFDDGGLLGMGQTGIVGERGPEIVKATSAGAVVTSRVDTARQMQSAGVLIGEIGVSVDDDGKVQAYVKRMSVQAAQQGAATAISQVRRNLPSWNNEYSVHGALA